MCVGFQEASCTCMLCVFWRPFKRQRLEGLQRTATAEKLVEKVALGASISGNQDFQSLGLWVASCCPCGVHSGRVNHLFLHILVFNLAQFCSIRLSNFKAEMKMSDTFSESIKAVSNKQFWPCGVHSATSASYVDQLQCLCKELADCMLRDSFSNVAVRCFASLGASGSQPSNAERDFHAWTRGLYGVHIDPYNLWVDVQLPEQVDVVPIAVPCLLVYEVMNAVAEAGTMQAAMSLLGPAGHRGVQEFWEAAMLEPWGKRHPALDPQGTCVQDLRKLIPTWWHVDGAEIFRNSEFVTWSWCSAVAESLNVWDYKFLYCLLPALLMQMKPVFKRINDAIAQLIGWDLRVCEGGVGPARGFYNEPFAADCSRAKLVGKQLGYKAVFAGMKTDGKARREAQEFSSHYNCTWLCA